MAKIIKIKSFAEMAMTEDDGMHLRKEIADGLADSDSVILDFSDIDLFATPFFNASIGYFVMKLTPDTYNKQICVENLSDLGKETYGHSYQNAISIYENKIDLDRVGKITCQTIEEQ